MVETARPTPYGPVPSPRQLAWHALEFYGFLHFTVNTFTDLEWGGGDESPALFNPSAFDADQIAETAHMAGMKGLILTCKHHDGFCLWPSRFTGHSVKNSPWRGGQGDVVREVSDACARQGLKFGVYLSPWDRNHPRYAYPEYLTYYRDQLCELLENYGPIFEVWFDGANGGDGFYGGARERREIDRTTYYDWDRTWQIVRDLQPQACMFSDAGPDIRWVGNERGIAGETCWATLNPRGIVPGLVDPAYLNQGDRRGSAWLPAECDVSIRPGWFYHAAEDDRVRSAQNLVDLYFQSVGRGASLLLNLPPDRRGQIHPHDVEALRAFRARLDVLFGVDLARSATSVSAPAWQQVETLQCNVSTFGGQNAVDGSLDTYWYPGDAGPPELTLNWEQPVRFNVLSLREYLPLGQRIERFALDAWQDDRWAEIATGASVGSRRLVRTPDVTTARVRLRIPQAPVTPALSELGLFLEERKV